MARLEDARAVVRSRGEAELTGQAVWRATVPTPPKSGHGIRSTVRATSAASSRSSQSEMYALFVGHEHAERRASAHPGREARGGHDEQLKISAAGRQARDHLQECSADRGIGDRVAAPARALAQGASPVDGRCPRTRQCRNWRAVGITSRMPSCSLICGARLDVAGIVRYLHVEALSSAAGWSVVNWRLGECESTGCAGRRPGGVMTRSFRCPGAANLNGPLHDP